jgi:hypothetical protein
MNWRMRPASRLHAVAWARPPMQRHAGTADPGRDGARHADFSGRNHRLIKALGNLLKILHRQDSISGGQLPIMGHRLPTRSPALWCLGSHQADASRNGKPDESRGRKAIGPSVRFPPDHGSLVPEMKRRPSVLLSTHGSPDLATVARDARSASPDRRVRQQHRRPSSASSTRSSTGPVIHRTVIHQQWARERGDAAGARAPANRIEADGANPPPRGG